MAAIALSPANRADALSDLATGVLDILVIGGGVVGAGAALDAATRGLRTGLVEARDLASGTSSRSSKLIHGGLRYLEMLDFRLVAEALSERGLMLETLAPHLVKPVKFLYPLKHRGWERIYTGIGMALYDGMSKASGRGAGVPLHRHLTRRRALEEAPALRRDALVGALQYYDAQVDDARHTVTVARTAAGYGARIATRTRVVDLLRDGGRVTGAVVVDLESGRSQEIQARQVINATGVWTDETHGLLDERAQFRVRASKGIHVVVPRDRIRSSTGMILRTEKSVLFVIPWSRHWIIGTTDTDWVLDKAHPAASAADVRYLLDTVNAVLRTPLTEADVEGVYAGLRPLLAGESDATSTLSREHAVSRSAPGLVVVAGGKYTTYRVMAEDAVDEAVRELQDSVDRQIPPSLTERVPLLGADGYRAMWNSRHLLATESGVSEPRIRHLLDRYGSVTGEVLELVRRTPDLGAPLAAAEDYLRAEVVYAVTHEGARHLDDVLCRRTRISIETFDRGTDCCREVADLMAQELGWDAEQRTREVEHYLARVRAERQSQTMPDDDSAAVARMGAAEIVPAGS
jgi:glycerol-3-phosphate dehydrogenase